MMTAATLLAPAIAIAASGGIVGLLFPRRSLLGQHVSLWLVALGSALGLVGAFLAMGQGSSTVLDLPAPFADARFLLTVDAISALFLLPVFGISLLGRIYG